MKALILAAGYATRLYPLTKEYPKSLLQVNSRPIIDYLLDKLIALEDLDEIIVVTNSKFISSFRKWRRALRIPRRLSLTLVDDLTRDNTGRRGAVGDMAFAITKKKIRDDLLVIGGDNLFDSGLEGFLDFARRHRSSPLIGAYDIASKTEARRYGVVKLDRNNRVVDFKEKAKDPKTSLVAMCLYYFPKEKLALINEYMSDRKRRERHDATGLYIDWLRRKVTVYSFVFGGRWYDIGDHSFYDRAKEKFRQGG